jgi:hypothetical protein
MATAPTPKVVAVTVLKGTVVWGPKSVYTEAGGTAYLSPEDADALAADGTVELAKPAGKAPAAEA